MRQKILKTSILGASIAALLCSSFVFSAEVAEKQEVSTEVVAQKASYGQIDAQGLKTLIDAHATFTLLDARGPAHYDGRLIPGAKLASYLDSDETLTQLIADKSELVVVYCASPTCPLSDKLADRLVSLHYQNVVVYAGGLKDWTEVHNFPIEKA